jgi:hypothetical protein
VLLQALLAGIVNWQELAFSTSPSSSLLCVSVYASVHLMFLDTVAFGGGRLRGSVGSYV